MYSFSNYCVIMYFYVLNKGLYKVFDILFRLATISAQINRIVQMTIDPFELPNRVVQRNRATEPSSSNVPRFF